MDNSKLPYKVKFDSDYEGNRFITKSIIRE